MVDEKIYVTDDGMEFILGERIMYNDKRFLLLYEKKSEKVLIAYESDGNLNFVDEKFPNYKDIFNILYNKYKSNK